ncbi:MAG: cyclic-phosphate processing receiver domain-containing protein [Cyanobacteriota bacterium]
MKLDINDNDEKTSLSNVFLDDTREPINAYNQTFDKIYKDCKWFVVKDYNSFIDYVTDVFKLEKKLPKIFSFDHNLADEHYQSEVFTYDSYIEKTGYHCALWLKKFCDNNKIDYPEIYSHSASPQGVENILNVFYSEV